MADPATIGKINANSALGAVPATFGKIRALRFPWPPVPATFGKIHAKNALGGGRPGDLWENPRTKVSLAPRPGDLLGKSTQRMPWGPRPGDFWENPRTKVSLAPRPGDLWENPRKECPGAPAPATWLAVRIHNPLIIGYVSREKFKTSHPEMIPSVFADEWDRNIVIKSTGRAQGEHRERTGRAQGMTVTQPLCMSTVFFTIDIPKRLVPSSIDGAHQNSISGGSHIASHIFMCPF